MQSFPSISNFNMKIQGVRHPIYRRWCLGDQDEARVGWEGKSGTTLALTKSMSHPKAILLETRSTSFPKRICTS